MVHSFNAYIVEMGIDEPTPPKNMGYLLTILKPHIGVILNALPVHAEQFGKQLGLTDQQKIIEAIAKEKGKLVTENPSLTTAILNTDQLEIASLKPKNGARVITFSRHKNADVFVESVKPTLSGTTISFRLKRSDLAARSDLSKLRIHDLSSTIDIPQIALPDFYGHTFASAIAVGLSLGIDPESACDVISKSFKLPPGRGQIFKGIKNTSIIDSSYNASRETMIGSLRLLQATGDRRQAMGILGDMRELGNQARQEHEAVARIALETLDEAILVGPLMKQYALPILEKKIPTHWFQTAGEATRFLLEVSQTSSTVILVKGSQNTIFLEIVVEALLADKKDVSKLCRRGTFWDRQRAQFQQH